MSKQNQTSPQGGEKSYNGNPESSNHVNYRAADGAVVVVTKIAGARRFPQHDYPIVCLHLRPQPGCRVQSLGDGSGGVDVLLSHRETIAMLSAMNSADPKSKYSWTEIPEKPLARKNHWKRINDKRHKIK